MPHGHNPIRVIPCECAHAARITQSTLAATHRSPMVRRPHKTAIVAVAHKVMRPIDRLPSRRVPWAYPGLTRNPPRRAIHKTKIDRPG